MLYRIPQSFFQTIFTCDGENPAERAISGRAACTQATAVLLHVLQAAALSIVFQISFTDYFLHMEIIPHCM